MMKTGDFAAPQKEEWGGEDKVEDWAADGQPAAAAAPAALAAPAPVAAAPAGYADIFYKIQIITIEY